MKCNTRLYSKDPPQDFSTIGIEYYILKKYFSQN